MAKLPSNRTVEELERLALTEVASSRSDADPFLLFLSTFDLLPGKHRVRTALLYNLFKVWLGCAYPGGKSAFTRKMGLVFPSNTTSGFLVSRSALELSGILRNNSRQDNAATRDLRMVESFCKTQKIYQGNYWIEFDALYYLYSSWGKGRSLSPTRLARMLILLLESRVTSDGKRWFRVSEVVREFLSDDVLAQLRAGWKRRDERQAKKEQKVG